MPGSPCDTIRILSLDGGGIYGLTQALWLQQLCQSHPAFLDTTIPNGPRYCFSGTSSGAVNAILLASQDNPRQLVTSGKLVQFWQEPGLYENRNPFDWALSFWGITPWLGTQDALQVLRAHLQDRRIIDIPKKHWLVVSTYNWHGSRPEFPPANTAPPGFPPWMIMPTPATMFPWMTPGAVGQGAMPWHPRMFTNFSLNAQGQNDNDYYLYDVAYGAIAMPAARAVRGGVGDGAIFNANPAVDTISAILYHRKLQHCPKGSDGNIDASTYPPDLVQDTLTNLHMLSIGDGAAQPNYSRRDFNYGPLPFMMFPSNPFPGPFRSFFSPQGYSLNQPIQDAAIQALALLDNRYHRMNPGVMPIPPGPCIYLVRTALLRSYLIQAIQQAVLTAPSNDARQASLAYLNNDWVDTAPPEPIL